VVSLSLTDALQIHILQSWDTLPPNPHLSISIERLQSIIPDFTYSSENKLIASSIQDQYYQLVADRLRVEVATNPRFSLILSLSRRPHCADNWFTLPIQGLGQTVNSFAFRLALRYRLGLPVYPEEFTCPRCVTETMDVYGDHAIHCRFKPGYKERHDSLRDVLCCLFREAGIQVVKEAEVSFLSNIGPSTYRLRPADILLPLWSAGKSTCVDVTGVSPFVTNGTMFLGENALLRAVSRKYAKHASSCSSNGFDFKVFGFDTFGSLSSDALSLLKRLQRSLSILMEEREDVIISYVWRRVAFTIFKSIAMQLVSRWPD
jgi:hypothetical protein